MKTVRKHGPNSLRAKGHFKLKATFHNKDLILLTMYHITGNHLKKQFTDDAVRTKNTVISLRQANWTKIRI
jgi:hypothetical protein